MASDNMGEQIAAAVRSPFVPSMVGALEREAPSYLEAVWPQLAPSVETAGFVGSALYMVDMALDAVEEVYKPLHSRESLLGGALDAADLEALENVLDTFHWVQPQVLLMLSALAEGWEAARVGGQGKPEPRETSDRETRHLATSIEFASASAGPLPEVTDALQLAAPPDLYRAVAVWPGYLTVAWDELQHLVAYPLFRRRGRALYFYARSSTRFLAQPIEVSREHLEASGVPAAELDAAHAILDAALPALATMMMHCCAMRLGIEITAREVVRPQ
ncbi:MAG: halocarboxylic acid dehydrogenase DehI family protein [Dehalococcoidia bacterium]